MSKKVKFARIIIFIILAGICIAITYKVLSWKDTITTYQSSMEMLYNTPDDTMDVVFVGNSHVNIGIDPEILWRDYGYSAFDLTISGTDISGNYHIIKEMLKTQSPKLVVVDLHAASFDNITVLANVYRKFLGMRTSANSIGMVTEDVNILNWPDYIFRFPIIHTRYKELGRYDFYENPVNTYVRGNILSFHQGESYDMSSIAANGDILDLKDSNKEWVDKLITLSEENDFDLLFIVTPCVLTTEGQGRIDTVKKYGEENGIPTIDGNLLGQELGLDYSTDFSDDTHLNTYGADKFTSYLAKYINENYVLENHKSESGVANSGYEQWDKALVRYNNFVKEDELLKSEDINAYVDNLLELENVKCIISLEGKYEDSIMDYSPALEKLGLNLNDFLNGGKWLYDNGTVERIYYNNPDAEPYMFELSPKYAVKVQFTDDEYGGLLQKDNILINRENYSNDGAYLRFIIYDSFLDEIIDYRGF